jgi:hypothetical protein
LLAENRDDALMSAALLAGTGHFDEAAEVLAKFELDGYSTSREKQRAAYQVKRWIGARGDESLLLLAQLPDAAPASESTSRARESVRHTGARAVSHYIAKRVADRAVAQRARGRSRDEVRSDLESEYELRGVKVSPLAVERTVDRLLRTSDESRDQRADDAQRAASNASDLLRYVSDPEAHATPDWLVPPIEASYRPQTTPHDTWERVELDTDGSHWMREVYDAAPRLGDTSVGLDAWLAPFSDDEPSPISVYVGPRRAGTLQAAAIASYGPLIRAAASRGELPCLIARLSHPSAAGGYLLEIRRPSVATTP